MKLLKILLISGLSMGVLTTTLSADAVKGQKLFSKKLKEACGINGAKFAAKHSQSEWAEIKTAGKFEDEIIKICPKVEKGSLSESILENVYDFSYEFANDSGNVPSC